MNKTKKRLLSYLLIAIGGLNLGTGVSNASPRSSTEKSEKNSKVSSIFNLRNGIDILGLLTMIYGGKKLRDKDNKIAENAKTIAENAKTIEEIDSSNVINKDTVGRLNRLMSEAHQECQKIDGAFELLEDFEWLFYSCAPFCEFSDDFGWKDLKKTEYDNYEFVCHQRIFGFSAGNLSLGTFLSRFFVAKVELSKNESINENILKNLKIDKDKIKSVLYSFNNSPKYRSTVGPVNAANMSSSYLSGSNKPRYVRIIEFEKIFSNKSFIDNLRAFVISKFNPGDPLCLEELKEKFKKCYIVCGMYEDPEIKGTGYLEFSLVKPKVSVED